MEALPPDLARFVEVFTAHRGVWVYLFVIVSMAVEYIVPPYPGDVAIFAAGILAALGKVSLWLVLGSSFVGSIVGVIAVYSFGRRSGRGLIASGKLGEAVLDSLGRIEKWYARFGARLLLFSKFIPGARSLLVVFAGIADVAYRKVLIYCTISFVLWNSLVILAAYYLEVKTGGVYRWLINYSRVALIIVILLVAFWIVRYLLARRPVR